MFAEMMGIQLPSIIAKDFSDVFQCYFSITEETHAVKHIFKTKEIHPFMPTLLIVDPQADPVALKNIPEFSAPTGSY